jgi:hypothetical protein
MAGDCVAAVGLLGMLLGSALSELELRTGENGVRGVSRAGDLPAIGAVTQGLRGQRMSTSTRQC